VFLGTLNQHRILAQCSAGGKQGAGPPGVEACAGLWTVAQALPDSPGRWTIPRALESCACGPDTIGEGLAGRSRAEPDLLATGQTSSADRAAGLSTARLRCGAVLALLSGGIDSPLGSF